VRELKKSRMVFEILAAVVAVAAVVGLWFYWDSRLDKTVQVARKWEKQALQAQSESKQLRAELGLAENKTKNIEKELVDSQTQAKKLEIELNDSRFKLENVQAESKKFQAELNNSQIELANLQKELSRSQAELADSQKKLQASEVEGKELRTNLQSSQEQAALFKKELVDSRTQVEKLQGEIRNLQAEMDKGRPKESARVSIPAAAIVKKGGGFEHASIGQLRKHFTKFGYVGPPDAKAIKKWVEEKAEQIAVLCGYIDFVTRQEIRIKGKGNDVAFVLKAKDDGAVQVEVYYASRPGIFGLVQTIKLAESFSASRLKEKQPFEYVFTPKKK